MDVKEIKKGLLTEHRKAYEITVLTVFLLGSTALVLGAATAAIGPTIPALEEYELYEPGLQAAALGMVLLLASIALAYPMRNLEVLWAAKHGGDRYERVKRWTQIKVSGTFLTLLTALAGIELGYAMLVYFDVVHFDATLPVFLQAHRFTTLFSMTIGATMAVAMYLSLRAPLERRTTGVETAYFALAAVGALILAILTGVLAATGFEIPGLRALTTFDAPFFMLAGLALLSVSLFLSRGLPTVYALFTEEREFYSARSHFSRSKSVVMPIMMAFALLFLVLFVLIAFQVGIVGLVEEVPQNIMLLSIFAVIIVSLLVSVVVSLMLSRSEDKTELYREKRSEESKKELTILSVSALVTTLLLAWSAAVFMDRAPLGIDLDHGTWADIFAVALMAAVGPYGFYYWAKARRVRLLEERFPDFLRDLAASRRAGLTLEASVAIAARGEYGALSPEIRKMADQLSWNVPFNEALERFGERVNTPLIQRAVSLITEASRSGGHVTDVLMAAATDARELKNLENERRTTMGLYTIVIYVAFFVFLGVVAVLFGTFIPEFLRSAEGVASTGSGSIGSFGFASLTLADFRTFYFLAAVVQGVGNGVVAGMMETGRGMSGLRHAFIMVAITWVIFGLIIG